MQRWMVAAAWVLATGCGGTQVAAEGTQATPKEAASKVAWKDMDGAARGKFMAEVVMPRMKTEFAAFDPKFVSMNCATCHGPKAHESHFAMPNAELMPLPGTMEGFQALGAEKPRWMEFMATKVKPIMAELLGQPEFNPAAPEKGGFGCAECHTIAKVAP